MPKTKFQDLVFTVIMVFTMVYCMTCYNMAREFGMTYSVFWEALKGMWFEAVVAFIAQKWIAGPFAKKMTARILTPGQDKPIFIIVAMAGFNVSTMCPIMTFVVALYHHHLAANLISLWLEKLVMNFPFALIIQLFYVGPLVRFVFRSLFKKQLEPGRVPVPAE